MPRLFALVLALGLALAGPAQQLFEQASGLLNTVYYGVSPLKPADLTQKYRLRLEELCRDQAECAYEVGVKVLLELLRELGDRHTNYYSPERYREFQATLSGGTSERPRLGVLLGYLEAYEGVIVLDVYGDSPAERAGLRRGDRIVAVDGQPFPQETARRVPFLNEATASGQPLRLSVLRGNQALELSVQPARINLQRLPSLTLREDGVAVLRIPSFLGSQVIGIRVHELVRQAQAAGARAMIVDLRGNGGGLVSECLAAAAAFTGESYRRLQRAIGFTEYGFRGGEVFVSTAMQRSVFYTLEPARWRGPAVVLVNKSTGSCAEYFAFDLQDAGYPVIGEVTAGVGNTVTGFYNLVNGGALQITTTQVMRRDGRPYAEAVTPDQPLSDDLEALVRGRDVLLEAGLERLGVVVTGPPLSQPSQPGWVRSLAR
jgi:carboxyl-terminal processing protease